MLSLGSPSIGVFEDNKRAIDLAKYPLSSSNSKHIDVRYHVLREFVGTGDLSAKYLRTEGQHADILTKAIGKESFEEHRKFLLFRNTIICCSSLGFVCVIEACLLIQRQGGCSIHSLSHRTP